MSRPITFGSVCSGVEAASVAFAPLGWKAAWLSEIEPFPCAVLAHHYPDVPNLGDMTKIAHLIRDGFVPAPDVFCGGTPCQAFSIAGLRNSLDDARGNLTLTFCEIANEIDTRRAADGLLPAVIFWENVPGVLSTKDNAFGCFLGALAGEDCALEPPGAKWADAGIVYGPQRAIAWRVTDAQYFGVAQRRRRVFVVASAREGFDPAAVLFEFDGLRRDSAPRRETGQDVTGTLSSRTTGGSGLGTDFELGGGFSHTVGTLRSSDGGSDVDHAQAGHPQPVVSTLDASYGRLQGASGQDANHGHSHLVPVAYGGNNQSGPIDVATARNACSSGSGSGSGRLDFETETFLVQPALSVALRGRDGGATAATSADRSRAAPVCITVDITHTLKAEGFDASEDGSKRGQPIIAFDTTQITSPQTAAIHSKAIHAIHLRQGYPPLITGMAVRRLTPRECERLQSFPDDYTLIPYGRTVRIEKLERDWIKYLLRGGVMTFEQVCRAAADGPRYKALGNSWCVNNVRWIGARIDRHLHALTGTELQT